MKNLTFTEHTEGIRSKGKQQVKHATTFCEWFARREAGNDSKETNIRFTMDRMLRRAIIDHFMKRHSI